jgi:hypothetical protein
MNRGDATDRGAPKNRGEAMDRRAWLMAIGLAVVCAGSWIATARAASEDRSPAHPGYSAPALYNLGNSYARSSQPALAVLNYERARILAPLDPDIQANLRHVRESSGLPAQSGSWLSRHGRILNPDTLYWLGVLGLGLAGSSLLARGRGPAKHPRGYPPRSVLGAAAALGLVAVALAVWDAAATASLLTQSVVMQPSPASASPIQGAEPLFTVPPAEVVSVRDEHAGFALIRDSLDREGWVARSNLTPIIPEAPR